MQAIVLAFTLKGQDEAKIIEKIREVAQRNPDTILIHGFMPRKEVVEKGWSTGILDAFDELFPSQIRTWAPNMLWREEMAQIAKKLNANYIVIGEVKEGVAEEVSRYKELGLIGLTWPLESAIK